MSDVVTFDLRGDERRCGPDCAAFLVRWERWWRPRVGKRQALLPVTPSREEYQAVLTAKSRNMVRKAHRLYGYREFAYNDHLHAIERINFSLPVRSGGPMRGPYLVPPEPEHGVEILCRHHRHAWHGAFAYADGQLAAYCNLILLNELAVVNTILRHGDAPASMNGMFDHLVGWCGVVGATHIQYLTLAHSPPSLARFKMSVGFREATVA